ncbi:MAG: 7-cyano-7-deazaguanine synthase QueC [Pseudomonadota bacterium]
MSGDKRAIVLVSGGLDSATVLSRAVADGYTCFALSFDYGQRHNSELQAAARVAATLGAQEHRVVGIDLGQFGGSALTDTAIDVPTEEPEDQEAGIPITYVPARNTIFLSFALAWAEVLEITDIFIGVNAVDYSGYPDCRPEFVASFENMANFATRIGTEGERIRIHTPLIDLTKAEIVTLGTDLGVDYAMTVSCYQADDSGAACGVCDSCRLRRAGFLSAGLADPTRYYQAI